MKKNKILGQSFKRSLQYTQNVCILLSVLALPVLSAQSIQELQRLKSEYDKAQKQIQLPTGVDGGIDPTIGLPRQSQFSPYQPTEIADEMEYAGLKHFGYDFFTRRDTVAFWENLPTPANYRLGHGDELVISLWGETQLRETYIISRDGKIYDEKVGLMNITGKSINEARQYLKDQYGRIYATLKGKTPTTFIDVSLGELRSINVNFVGEVQYPGVYPVHSFSTVITGLIQSGGVDTTGSLRTIQVKRDGEVLTVVDLYDYLLKGNLSDNIQLRDQDIVVIPVRKSTVELDSAIVNPGIYEGVAGETVFDLIQYAGGLTPDAADKIGLSRIKPMEDRSSNGAYEGYYINIKRAKLIPIQNGDRIGVRHLFKENQLVEIIGRVKVPGMYHFYNGMTLKSLLALGGGFEDSTFWKSVYHDQAEIIRRDPESRYENVIKVNLGDIYNSIGDKDIPLQNLDRVVIHANSNYFEKDNIYISGEVNIPGAYPLISDNETLHSVISRAGNFTSKALKNGISIYRDKKYFEVTPAQSTVLLDTKLVKDTKVRVAWQNESITLMPGDSVVVKEKTMTVNVSGEVYNPGLIEFRKGKRLKYYINGAGGVSNQGNKNNIIVVYANGVVSPNKWYSTPTIEDGSTIIVNEKPPSEPFNPTDFANTTLSLLSSLVTILVLSKQL
ncbi:SLBB domain-containing protein [Candidatus Marinimicrobia bacterium]|nr:SLBB domain-containing protein [Candidatus Neomarinimicrobiota bacterium]